MGFRALPLRLYSPRPSVSNILFAQCRGEEQDGASQFGDMFCRRVDSWDFNGSG